MLNESYLRERHEDDSPEMKMVKDIFYLLVEYADPVPGSTDCLSQRALDTIEAIREKVKKPSSETALERLEKVFAYELSQSGNAFPTECVIWDEYSLRVISTGADATEAINNAFALAKDKKNWK